MGQRIGPAPSCQFELRYLILLTVLIEKGETIMQMMSCPNCNKLTGFKRALGFGTFFAVVMTAGLWLLVIPFYPQRCIVCGLSHNSLMLARNRQGLIFLGILLAVAFVADLVLDKSQSQQGAPIVKGPNYNEPSKLPQLFSESKPPEAITEAEPALEVAPATDEASKHIFREDGRVYSVALVASADIAVGATVLAQGTVARFGYAGMQSRPYAVLIDGQHPDKALMCAMQGDEGAEVLSLFHVQELVNVSGEYMGAMPVADNPTMPVIRDCHVSDGIGDAVHPDTGQR